MCDETFDLRGLKCPLPALFSRRVLARAAPGSVVEVWADDPLACVDIPYMCQIEGFDVIGVVREGDWVRLRLRRPA